MFSCDICGKQFELKHNLYRHIKSNKSCVELRRQRLYLEKIKDKYNRTKNALKCIVEERKELKLLIDRLNNDNLNLQKKNKELIDDRNLLYHQLEVEKAKTLISDKKDKVIVELAKQNKASTNNIVINNTIIINNSKIKDVDELIERLNQSFLQTISNLQNHNKLLNIN